MNIKPSYTSTRYLMGRLWREHIKSYTGRILLSLVFMVVSGIATAFLAKMMKPIIDDVFTNKDVAQLHQVAGFVLLVFFVKGFSSYGETVTMNYVGQRVVSDIQERLFKHLLTLDLSFFYKMKTGALMARCTNDVTMMRETATNLITNFGKDLVTLVALVVVMFQEDVLLACIAFFVFPIAVLPIVRIGKKMRKVSINTQEEFATFMTALEQTIQGMRVVKAYGMQKYESKRISKIIKNILKLIYKSTRVSSMSRPIMETLGGIAVVAIITYGGWQVIEGTRTAGTFFSFITALLLAYAPMKSLANLNAKLQQGLAAAARVFATLDMQPEITNKPEAKALKLTAETSHITFQDVGFEYSSDRKILENITFDVPTGTTVALVGESGSGKSTLLNLIPRFFDVKEGAIKINGHDVRDVKVESLRSGVALVSQEVTLFDDTIKANILYGKPNATEKEVVAAARAAAAHDFIKKLPKGYNTIVGEQGVKLSGGQRQRIAIARAMIKNAPILLLDEATSALDTVSEKQVQVALKKLMAGKTVIVIAHRLSTVRDADCIYVLEDGKIVESGHHRGLLELNGTYSKLCELQLAG